MSIYFDTNVYYHKYCPTDHADIADWIFDQLTKEKTAISSEWIIPEMFRALKKQVNLGIIEESDANIALDFFLSDIRKYERQRKIVLYPIQTGMLFSTRDLIFSQNLFASDALHLVTAQNLKVLAFITFDSDFKPKLNSIPILKPKLADFQKNFNKIFSNFD